MCGLERLAAWFFSSLGVVLALASILVVPADAFADGGTYGEECYEQCYGSEDPECTQYCCEEKCGGNDTCLNECVEVSQQKNCNVVFCEGGCSLQKPSQQCGDRKYDGDWCLKKYAQCNGCVCGDWPEYPNTCTCRVP
jgi:hypothetical protein